MSEETKQGKRQDLTMSCSLKVMKRSLVFFALLQFAFLCPAEEISCPLMIEPIPDKLPTPPQGWEVRQVPRKYTLGGFGINIGDPKVSDADAIYDDVKTSKKKNGDKIQLHIWDLKNLKDPYVTCFYEGVGLVRSLQGFKRCEMELTSKSSAFRAEITSAKCF